MSVEIINCLSYEEQILHKTAHAIARLQTEFGVEPSLATILVGEDPASKIYVANKVKHAEAVGIKSRQHVLPDACTQAELANLIHNLNEDSSINGILLQLPLPQHLCGVYFTSLITPEKDVDGLSTLNAGLLASGNSRAIIPCTPLGILYVLKSIVPLKGLNVVVVGRSNLVGLPAALLCLQANATVTICHSGTANLKEQTQRADVLIVAAGCPDLIDGSYVKPGAVVVDVGINRVENSSLKKGYYLQGDVRIDNTMPSGVKITPVPKGVGRLTVACLMYNTYISVSKQLRLKDSNYEDFWPRI